MYNNAIIKTNYKPYIPPPKKKVDKEAEHKQPETKSQVVQPNDYSNSNNNHKGNTDSFNRTINNPAKININQVLIDFRSTLNAIGASEDIEKEVVTYLGLVETQAQKANPNKKMIISNLKIAADVLDGYISETLNKPSRVVKDWIDALLLQNVDFKADANVVKGAFESITGEAPQTEELARKKLAKKNEKIENEASAQVIETTQTVEKADEDFFVSSETENKILELVGIADTFIISAPQKALNTLSEAFAIVQKYSDKNAMSEIYSKIAIAHNNMNNISQALDCFNASTTLAYVTNNDTLKTYNHKMMGRIYDEAGYMDTAISHYYASLGIDGKLEDTLNQADTLNTIGKMYTTRYIKEEAVDYYKDALELAKVSKNLNMMSDIFKNTAVTYKNAGQNDKAIANYKQAALLSKKSGNNDDLALIYEQAADLMSGMKHNRRAADLYKKSYRLAQEKENNDALARLRKKLLECV